MSGYNTRKQHLNRENQSAGMLDRPPGGPVHCLYSPPGPKGNGGAASEELPQGRHPRGPSGSLGCLRGHGPEAGFRPEGRAPRKGRLERDEPEGWRPRGGCGFGQSFVGASHMGESGRQSQHHRSERSRPRDREHRDTRPFPVGRPRTAQNRGMATPITREKITAHHSPLVTVPLRAFVRASLPGPLLSRADRPPRKQLLGREIQSRPALDRAPRRALSCIYR